MPVYFPKPLNYLLKPLLHTRPQAVRLDVYHTCGTPDRVSLKGRALEKKSTDQPLEIADSWWMNIRRTWNAIESDEIPDLELRLTFQNHHYAVTTDDEGLFDVPLDLETPLKPGVYEVRVELVRQGLFFGEAGVGKVFIYPTQTVSCGVISDIDDTILETDVTRKRTMLKKLAFGNALTATDVPGMANVYAKLSELGYGFHYLSGSPINLHQRLRAFLKHRGFPEGSMDLRHWGIGPGTDAIFSSTTYKLQRLQTLFQRYPERQFILIGDSGEKDPEIYSTIYKTFSHQIRLMAIHNVTGDKPNQPRYKHMLLFEHPEEILERLQQTQEMAKKRSFRI